ncbi:putative bifunctional phosphatase/peptidyl-prolyl cis-trans isomerase [Lentilactobacillus parabuchneri]|jgi:peptidyl-prolyl cis-trans isomerase B (cyclophilin B)|uniref:Peptidyl-prolyl cis-trans isomerase n=2 Tax=Lentilactobacillus parabuchneri TaxID=152331 RepID=A0A1X1FDU6_9LACO|nr:peptidylprolyl isomerase [Lentilactobacillus parabuchneri]APR07809.1 Putative bifunctional phosphatase/peptidyl-prolyl cis-trans isomerase [Lentilactobacillus parabuchneri]KRM47051.1 peptidyl-prolyl isomerase [Lentilactobacillus parabuchneri DSM 5707 = NBRC 107865]KRN70812.1 peptidyl-prolyl isomerase [Lentilactobacillus parabuchneri]MBW0222221.1 peptidylprolyl isomerase [Lentilactobacillus parabuchneri]MBW0245542.1 peptidylprolyl isomerase [Lentilactobacillus parabuchneri]
MTLPQLDLANAKGPKATIKTNHGEIVVQLFPEQAPKTVENFVALAEKGYYNGVVFHRVIPDFMIQGGDPTGTGMGGESSFGGNFADEFSPELFNIDGALSMANAGPDTNGSQFFIVTNEHVDDGMVSQMKTAGYPEEIIDAYKNGGTPWLDFRHTVFGQVISGMDVVKEISKVDTNAQDKPKDDVIMESVVIDK